MEKLHVLHVKRKIASDGATMMICNLAQASTAETVVDCLVADLAGSDWAYKIEALGGKVHCIPDRGSNPVSRRINKFKDYRTFFQKHPYDVVHVDTDSLLQIDVSMAARAAGIKCRVMHSHSSHWESNHSNALASVLRFFMGFYTTDFMACSAEAGQWLFPKRVQDRVTVLKNGIDTEKFQYSESVRRKIREQYNLTDEFVIGHVGRFVEVKNHKFLLKQFAAVKEKCPKAKLMLIGEGPLETTVREQASALGLTDDVLFVGMVENVHEYLSAMDVFVLPSLFEGLPVSLIEAQANGLRCVVSSTISREVKLLDSFTYVDLDADSDLWVSSILGTEKPSGNAEERLAARETIVNAGYDIRAVAGKVIDIYNNRLKRTK